MKRIDLSSGELIASNWCDNDNNADTVDVAVTADAETREAAVLEARQKSLPIQIQFAKFNDGRGFSIARLLREQHGFAGEIRAIGHVIPDQALHLLRAGFDTAALRDDSRREHWREALSAYGSAYQTAARNPLQRRRDGELAASGPKRAERLATRLERSDSLAERVRIIADAAGGRVAFSTSLGKEDQALLHAIAESGAAVDVFTLDTLKHFPETLETLRQSEERYGLTIRRVAPDPEELAQLVARDGEEGFRDSIDQRKACCQVRKVQPLNRSLAGSGAWITGLRRQQSPERAGTALSEWDAGLKLLKVSPLADWNLSRLETYLSDNGVPVNPLHARGFPSIGCLPCTRAIHPGEDERAGRWWWENQEGKECGLHSRPAVGDRQVA